MTASNPSTAPATSFVQRPVYLIKRISVANQSRNEAALRELGLTLPQYAIMNVLYEASGVSGAEVARRSFVSRQLVHRELSGLRELGLITQQRSATDGRVEIVDLTDEGRARIEAAIAPLVDLEQESLTIFSEEERAQLTEFLTRWANELRDR